MTQDTTSTPIRGGVFGEFEVQVTLSVYVTLRPSDGCRNVDMAAKLAARLAHQDVNAMLYFPQGNILYGGMRTQGVCRNGKVVPC